MAVKSGSFYYETSPRGNPILVMDSNRYIRNRESKKTVFWRCARYYQSQVCCPGSVAMTKTDTDGYIKMSTKRHHNSICEEKRQQSKNAKEEPSDNKEIYIN